MPIMGHSHIGICAYLGGDIGYKRIKALPENPIKALNARKSVFNRRLRFLIIRFLLWIFQLKR